LDDGEGINPDNVIEGASGIASTVVYQLIITDEAKCLEALSYFGLSVEESLGGNFRGEEVRRFSGRLGLKRTEQNIQNVIVSSSCQNIYTIV
jgi:hypothetical protein